LFAAASCRVAAIVATFVDCADAFTAVLVSGTGKPPVLAEDRNDAPTTSEAASTSHASTLEVDKRMRSIPTPNWPAEGSREG
jgi:hypothetical protein